MTDLDSAVAALQAGLLVAFPTETVYGLGADARNDEAIARVFAAKGRPTNHPVIVHLASVEQLAVWSRDLPDVAVNLAHAFSPGPITFLVHKAKHVSSAVTGGRDTVGLRIPNHPVALALLAQFGDGVVGPSANRFGHVSPTSAADVLADLGDRVEVILDGGPCDVGIESTIVDCTTDPVTILRRGAVTPEMIEVVLGMMPLDPTGPSRAPGMLESHYAPRCAIVLVTNITEAHAVKSTIDGRVGILDPGPDLAVYAHGLYGWLRDADRRNLDTLIVVRPANVGLGSAILERLTKAAAPRR